MSRYAILNEKREVVPVDDVLTWGAWFEKAERRVAETIIGNVRISTVFLGMNNAFHPNDPAGWFETMVFGGKLDQDQWRCETWDQATAQHGVAEALVRAGGEA
jgi:hypothetical protein